MPYIQIDTEVWLEPEEFLNDLKDDEIVEELTRRGYYAENLTKVRDEQVIGSRNMMPTLETLYEMKKTKDARFEKAFADYCYLTLGKVL